MGKLICHQCGAIWESETFKEAIESIDHSIGLHNSRPCPNDGTNHMTWNGIALGKDRKEPYPNPRILTEDEIPKKKPKLTEYEDDKPKKKK